MGLTYYLDTIWISLQVIIISLLTSLLLSIVIVEKLQKWKYYKYLDLLLTLPIFLPPLAIGYLFLLMFSKNSILAQFLALFNIYLVFDLMGAILIGIVVSLPIIYRAYYVASTSLDRNLINVARLNGASKYEIFKYIRYPLLKKQISSALLLASARILGEYGATSLVAGSIIGKTHTISMGIYLAIETNNQRMALVWFLILWVIAIVLLTRYQKIVFKKGD